MIAPTDGAVPVTPVVVTEKRPATTPAVFTGSLNVTVNGNVAASVGDVPATLIDDTVGFVVSKAVGNAVTRTLVKRRLRHLVRERLTELPAGALLVVRAQPAAADATYAELRDQLDRCLQRCLRKAA